MYKTLPEVENPLLYDRIPHPFERPIEWAPTVRCKCGCDKEIDVIELRTHEGEPVYSESCFMRIAYKEGWIVKEAV